MFEIGPWSSGNICTPREVIENQSDKKEAGEEGVSPPDWPLWQCRVYDTEIGYLNIGG